MTPSKHVEKQLPFEKASVSRPMLKNCCCGKCLLRTGSMCTAAFFTFYRLCVVGLLVAAFLFFDEIDEIFYYRKKDTIWLLMLVAIVVNGIDFILSIALTIGVARQCSLPVLIWIIFEMLNLVFVIVVVVVFMILTQFQMQYIVALGITFLLSGFKIYLILTVVSYYQYLKSAGAAYTISN